jgi:hypothetical protein
MSWRLRLRSSAWATEVNRFTVFYDACVLYPAPLRDLLMRLALTDLYRARWSDQIHEEWITAVLRNRSDLSRAQLERTRSLMNAHVRDALVDGYQSLIPALALPDPDDRHVLAAAIKRGADLIVTFNLDDFPDHVLASYGSGNTPWPPQSRPTGTSPRTRASPRGSRSARVRPTWAGRAKRLGRDESFWEALAAKGAAVRACVCKNVTATGGGG